MDTSKVPKSFEDYVKNLRRYKKDTIVINGAAVLWELFQNKNFSNQNARIVLKAFGPKVILLALATGNNCRSSEIKDFNQFYDLCTQYLHIPVPIEDKQFLDIEANKIQEMLIIQNSIPPKYINIDMRECTLDLGIQRSIVEQNQHHMVRIQELYTDYLILKRLDDDNDGLASKILYSILDLSLLQTFRSAFAIFSHSNNRGKYGFFDLNNTNFDPDLKIKFGIDFETCQKISMNISCKESELRQVWYESEVLSQAPLYQRYVPTPLNSHPIVHLDKTKPGGQCYLTPSPDLFIRGFRQAIFSHMFKSKITKNVGDLLGDAIELHIFQCLKHIFGRDKVVKIDHDGKKADFYIPLESIDLIIETKSDIGCATRRLMTSR